jgi:hypothetical protein
MMSPQLSRDQEIPGSEFPKIPGVKYRINPGILASLLGNEKKRRGNKSQASLNLGNMNFV